MEKTLYRFIWRYSARRQMVILLLTLVSFPILYMSLELPKQIVNDAIQGTDFPREILGVEFGQIDYLLLLCLSFLGLVVLNNVVKFTLNIFKGLTGERMLRRLRYILYERMMRFRLPHFRKVSSGEIIPMITAEVEPLGGFIGDAIAQPAFQGGTLIVYIVFIFAQDPLLGAAAIALYPIQGYIIPKLQKRVIILQRERVKNIRRMADRIGESVAGVSEIHANDTSAWHLSNLSDILYTNFLIRYEIFKRKFLIKFVNNFMNQLPPFMFYSIGGYLVINGDITFGALVAVLAAYKDLAGPWKELLDYYQDLADVNVRYQTVVENFDPPDLYPHERIAPADAAAEPVSGDLALSSVSFDSGVAGQQIQDISLRIAQGESLAVVGGEGSGRPELVEVAAGLISPSSGRVEFGGRDMEDLTEAVLGREIAFVGPSPHIFTGTVRDNLLYGLRHRPRAVRADAEVGDEEKQRRQEAERTGNIAFTIDDPWEDLSVLSVESDAELDNVAIELAGAVGLSDDIYRMGLHAYLDEETDSEIVAKVLEMRASFAERINRDPQLNDLVDLWDVERMNASASLAENVMFALPNDRETALADIPKDPVVIDFLRAADLLDDLVGIGVSIAEIMIELFADVRDETALVGTFSFIDIDELPTYDAVVKRVKASGQSSLKKDEVENLIGLAFQLIPARHRLGVVTEEHAAKIVAARKVFRERAETFDGRYVLFARDKYVEALTIEENIVFGKPRLDRRGSAEEIEKLIGETADSLGLRTPIERAGLDFHVGVSGSRLSSGQRRRISLARALMKKPSVFVFEDVEDTFGEDVRMIATVRRLLENTTVIAGSSRLQRVADFNRIVLLRNGCVVAEGGADDIRAMMGGSAVEE